MQNTEPESPYKFLHYYRKKDRDIFFGRKGETRVLLSDVAVTRLVVLFAKTGTGKTSLINAGVRPILEEEGYATFFIRVKRDPIESARRAILDPDPEEGFVPDNPLEWPANMDFAGCLESIAGQLNKDIVLFFDQFEEFFIYPLKEAELPGAEAEAERLIDREEQMRRRRDFISNVATIYHNEKSRVHLVFSMREEWFVELDVFRDLIPKIFHNESNLRLRWFNPAQARDAIKLPAKKFGIEVEDEVVDRLIADLSDNGKTEIEPAQLQIVCDTLWWSGDGDSITLEDYVRLGKLDGEAAVAPGKGSIARRILFKRLGREFEEIKDDEQLQLLYALLPKLGTPWKTKYVRDINGLVKELASDDPALREVVTDDMAYQALVEKLKRGGEPLRRLIGRLRDHIGFVRTGMRDNLEVVELAHDYLVGNLADLQAQVRAIPPRRTLEEVMGRGDGVPATPDEVETISESADVLTFTAGQARKMFRSALAHGLEPYTGLWFRRAKEDDTWEVLRQCLEHLETSSYAIHFLADLGSPRAYELLESALEKEEVASYAIEVVSRKESDRAVDFLLTAARRPELFRAARKGLKRVGKTARRVAVAERARRELARLDEANPRARGADPITADLGVIVTGEADTGTGEFFRPAPEAETLAAEVLAPHFKSVIKSVGEGRIIMFLGAEAHCSNGGAPGGVWSPGHTLPSARELAAHVAARFNYPPGHPDARDLSRVAQYAWMAAPDRGELYSALREAFKAEPELSRLHRLLPRLAAGGTGTAPVGNLLLTAGYDDLLERAFGEQGVPFHLLTYLARGKHAGKFLHFKPEGDPAPIESPLEYRGLSGGYPVIVKISGGINRHGPEYDSFVITEDDYIEQLSLLDVVGLLPLTLAARMRRSPFLFLGYSPRTWNARVLLQRIWGRRRPSHQSWAIQNSHDPIERALWREMGVEPFSVSLDSYAAELERHVDEQLQEI